MRHIKNELIQWAIHKIKTEYPEDVSLLIGHKHWNIAPDGDDVAFNFFIPSTQDGYKLSQTFIIEGIGYDLFPMSWERVEGLSNINESLTTCLADGVILYAKTAEDKARFMALQERLKANLDDEPFAYKKGLEKINTAMEIYKTMVFEDNLCQVRKASGFIADYLSQALVTLNGTYFQRGPENQMVKLSELAKLPDLYISVYETLITEKSITGIKELCYQMIDQTRSFFMDKKPEKEKVHHTYNNADLAAWYEEGIYTFRRIYYYVAQGDVFNTFAWGYNFQREFDSIEVDFNLEPMDLMGTFDSENLAIFSERAKEIESYIRGVIEERGAKINEYENLEAFLASNRS